MTANEIDKVLADRRAERDRRIDAFSMPPALPHMVDLFKQAQAADDALASILARHTITYDSSADETFGNNARCSCGQVLAECLDRLDALRGLSICPSGDTDCTTDCGRCKGGLR